MITSTKRAPFSKNQLAYRERSKTAWMNLAEGTPRGGKNVLNCAIWCEVLEYHPSQLHLMAGFTAGGAGSTIWKSDGLGLESYFAGRFREGRWGGTKPCYYIYTATGEKAILRGGGNNVRSQDIIAGETLGTAYITEANRCHHEFIIEVERRTRSVPQRKIFHDINPREESHWYYEKVADFYANMQAANSAYGYNYGHFTMADNMSMSDEQIRKVIEGIPKPSVWYDRDVLGLRKAAEGRVYPTFNYDNHTVDAIDRPYGKYRASVDYGTVNKFVVLLWGLCEGTWYCVDELVYDSKVTKKELTSEDYRVLTNKFLGDIRVEWVIIDSAAADFRVALRRDYPTKLSDKSVAEGIRSVADAFHLGLIKINRNCKHTIKSISEYMWDAKFAGAWVPLEHNDHEADALRYFVYTDKLVEIYHKQGGGR